MTKLYPILTRIVILRLKWNEKFYQVLTKLNSFDLLSSTSSCWDNVSKGVWRSYLVPIAWFLFIRTFRVAVCTDTLNWWNYRNNGIFLSLKMQNIMTLQFGIFLSLEMVAGQWWAGRKKDCPLASLPPLGQCGRLNGHNRKKKKQHTVLGAVRWCAWKVCR